METKKYSSYAQIETEQRLKRNQLSKLAYGFQKNKESITPQNIVSDLIGI
jgi:hypothetical protein